MKCDGTCFIKLVFIATPLSPRADPIKPYKRTANESHGEYGDSAMAMVRIAIEIAIEPREPSFMIAAGA